MASPCSANEPEDDIPRPDIAATELHTDHQKTSKSTEEIAITPAFVGPPDIQIAQESPRPKSEDPCQDISGIPQEVAVDDSAHGVGERAAPCASETNSPQRPDPGSAKKQDVLHETSNYSMPPTSELTSAVNENIVSEAAADTKNPIAISNVSDSRTIVLKKKLFKTPKERALEAAQNERRLQEAGELFRQSLLTNPPTSQSATLAKYTLPHINSDNETAGTGHQSFPVKLDTEVEDAAAASLFNSYKKIYERKKKKGWNTVEEDVAFSKARNAEEHRLKLNSRKLTYQVIDPDVEALEDDDELFVAEGTPSSLGDTSTYIDLKSPTAQKRHKACRPNRIPESAFQDATQIGYDALEAGERRAASRKRQPKGPVKKKTPKGSKTRVSKSKDKKVNRVSKAKRGRPRKGPEMTNLQTLFNNDIVSAAQANVGKAGQPGFASKNKREALAELIASIPENERTTHNADKNALDKATKSFTGYAAMKADGNNGWRLRGMKTSLYHYQLLGAAFMRDRENSRVRPYGGLQSDEMGLGKTLTCLANIVDGQAPPNSPNRTTLIVCPSALCTQWLSEIRKHVLPDTFQETIIYRAGGRIESADPTKTLSNTDIIITSYNEVLRSYPNCDIPKHLVTPKARVQWWSDYFKANRGVLHQIFFRRIVLDEAHAIKNHNSKTSIAIRSLAGKYRWAISGTPIQNNLEEFYPFFSFLKVPHTGCQETFKNNFARRNKTTNLRLQTLLRQIMIRRTHLDTIFGRPLLQLPGITTKTVKVEFNECEKAIYNIVKNRFVKKITTYAKSGDLDNKFRNIFVLFLRLRQLVGHILLIQQTLKDLMEGEDLERLWRLTEAEVQPQGEQGSQTVLGQLRKMLSKAQDAQKILPGDSPQLDPADDMTEHAKGDEEIDDVGGTFGITFKFRKYLTSLKDTGKWEEMNKRSLCYKCGGVPDDPYMTSCFHLYCKECLTAMLFNAGEAGKDKAKCLVCDAEFADCEPCRGFDQAGFKFDPPITGPSDRQDRKSTDSEESDVDWLSLGGSILPSAKTLAVKAQIQNWVDEDPDAKIIVFTQFRPMIRILSRLMQEEGWGSSQFHGSMSFPARDRAILDFAQKPETKVLLASLKAGGVGLNLTMASKVIIMDLWWNECVEQQAFCRCFRIGQDRPVDICRIVVKDSVDDDILAMQERKTTEIDMAMAAKNRPGNMTTRELVHLFGPIDLSEGAEDDIMADPFIFVEDEHGEDDASDGEAPTRVPLPPFA